MAAESEVNCCLPNFRTARGAGRSRGASASLPALALLIAAPAGADPPAPPSRTSAPLHIPAPGGEVILPDSHARMSYERGGYAAVRRAGDFLFLSGMIVYRRPDERNDVPAFKDQVRRTFQRLGQSLAAAGASFDDVVTINSFHVWNGPDFAGSRDEQFKAFEEVKEEYMHGPHPAWTAVGAAGLLGEGGIVEVQMTAYAPVRRRR